ncbi:MAG TPA: tetratricopeptide repeat protein [Polyangiales bacterium]|nr:tetratricopeptide repeat protein [Polyangiales bacterium]
MKTAILALLLVGCAHTSSTARSSERPTAGQLYAVARLAEQRGDSLRAQQYYVSALQEGYDSHELMPRLLRLYVADGQYRLAIARAKETLDEHGEDLVLRLLLAELYRATELDVPAEQEYQHVLAQQPNNARAHLELALLLQHAGRDVGRADEHLRAYLALEPHGPGAAEARGRLMKEVP